jgi:hypothetical protein
MDYLIKAQSTPLHDLHEKHRKAARFFGVTLDKPEVDDTVTVSPVVNHGRWIIHCPWCASAEMAGEYYFCSQGCFNAAVGRRYVRVDWPKHKDQIERILCQRLDPANRNWTGESIGELARENQEHGL